MYYINDFNENGEFQPFFWLSFKTMCLCVFTYLGFFLYKEEILDQKDNGTIFQQQILYNQVITVQLTVKVSKKLFVF